MVGESPAPVSNVQYWLTLNGILGRVNGAVATQEREKRSTGCTTFTILWLTTSYSCPSDSGTSFSLRGSQRTTLPAFLRVCANKLSSFGERGSVKCTSKAITIAPSLARFSIN